MRLVKRSVASSGEPTRSSERFPPIAIPARVLKAARDTDGAVQAADVVEEFLRDTHGPEPDHRGDREHWLAYLEATSERALLLAVTGQCMQEPLVER